MNDSHDTNVSLLKLLLAWAGTMFGGLSLSTFVLGATLVYTLLNIYVLIRKIRREARMEHLEAKLRHGDTQ